MLAISACRPAKPAADAANLRDTGVGSPMSGPQTVTVSLDSARYTFKPDRSDVKLTELRDLSLFGEKKGRIGELKAKSWITLPAATFSFELAAQPDVVCRSVAANLSAGVALKGQIALSCISQSDQRREIKEACKMLAADSTIATFEDNRDSCYCPKRRAPDLRYADYLGHKATFISDCKNVATKLDLKAVCAEIRDRFCKTCKIDELACECPKGGTLLYTQYFNDPEQFRATCMDGVPNVPQNPTETQQSERFRGFCNRGGGSFIEAARTSSGKAECECRAARRYTVEDFEYYKDREDTFRNLCLSD